MDLAVWVRCASELGDIEFTTERKKNLANIFYLDSNCYFFQTGPIQIEQALFKFFGPYRKRNSFRNGRLVFVEPLP